MRSEGTNSCRFETGPTRIVRDDTGRVWRVREFKSERSAEALVFESDDVMRRVRDYPADWPELPDEELFALSRRW